MPATIERLQEQELPRFKPPAFDVDAFLDLEVKSAERAGTMRVRAERIKANLEGVYIEVLKGALVIPFELTAREGRFWSERTQSYSDEIIDNERGGATRRAILAQQELYQKHPDNVIISVSPRDKKHPKTYTYLLFGAKEGKIQGLVLITDHTREESIAFINNFLEQPLSPYASVEEVTEKAGVLKGTREPLQALKLLQAAKEDDEIAYTNLHTGESTTFHPYYEMLREPSSLLPPEEVSWIINEYRPELTDPNRTGFKLKDTIEQILGHLVDFQKTGDYKPRLLAPELNEYGMMPIGGGSVAYYAHDGQKLRSIMSQHSGACPGGCPLDEKSSVQYAQGAHGVFREVKTDELEARSLCSKCNSRLVSGRCRNCDKKN